MRLIHHVSVGMLSLLMLALSTGSVVAQTPDAEIDDPCASFALATPGTGDSPASINQEELPEIQADEAVVGALAIRQGHVVTALEAIIAFGGPDLVAFATEQLPTARQQLDTLQSIASKEAIAHPAAMIAVLDMLRQEQDLPADQGDLDGYLPGYVVNIVCIDDIDREAVSQQTLMANDVAVVEIAGIGELVIEDDDALALVEEVSESASDRLTWFQARTVPEATPAATPAT